MMSASRRRCLLGWVGGLESDVLREESSGEVGGDGRMAFRWSFRQPESCVLQGWRWVCLRREVEPHVALEMWLDNSPTGSVSTLHLPTFHQLQS